jgi:two-component system CheB/CheR fusion protein
MPTAAEPTTWKESTSTAPLPTPKRTRTVLVVEDNPDSREMLRLLLKLSGFEVTVAADGPKALEAIQAEPPDVALIDIGLPEIDGYEVARRVRREQHNDKVHLIALTGYGRPEDREAILEAGFDVHVVKPPRHEELVRLISQA